MKPNTKTTGEQEVALDREDIVNEKKKKFWNHTNSMAGADNELW